MSQEAHRYEVALRHSIGRIDHTLATCEDRYPLYADPRSGVWATTRRGSWTAGFWVGLLWLRAVCTEAPAHADVATMWTYRLCAKLEEKTVTRAMTFWHGAAAGYLLTGVPAAAEVALQGAERLAGAFDPALGLLPEGSALRPSPRPRASIDAVAASTALLSWAGGYRSNDALTLMAHRNFATLSLISVDAAGQVIPASTFTVQEAWQPDPAHTNMGAGWARGHAWAMLAAAAAATWLGDEYLPQARHRADRWLAQHMPGAGLPRWHLHHEPDVPDTSAAAMAAVALFKIHELSGGQSPYAARALDHLEALLPHVTTPNGTRPGGMLLNGSYTPVAGVAPHHELIWGDYFLVQALMIATGRLAPEAI
ncbi:hypothetical protein [Actinocrispum sp. NPDC049592]|uniref:hypothetical protein n=1 Tax=Actinocrispum sp. NPDC049592 TaxID=3154835 RepID=UPI00344519D0